MIAHPASLSPQAHLADLSLKALSDATEMANESALQCKRTADAIAAFKWPASPIPVDHFAWITTIDHDMIMTTGWGLFAVAAVGLIYYFAKGAITAA